MKIETVDLNPVLLTARMFNGYQIKGPRELEERVVYDYEIEYYTKSEGGVWIDGIYTPYKSGDIGIRKPGQQVRGILPYNCYLIVIDLAGEWKKKKGYRLGTLQQAQPNYENPILQALPNKIVQSQISETGRLVKKIYESHLRETDIEEINIKMMLLMLLKNLYEASQSKKQATHKIHPVIREAIQYMTENFTNEIEIGEIIERSNVSKAYFHRLFQETTGGTPIQFLSKLRMEKAKTLLILTQEDISEIAYECGYYDPVYFSYVFKKMMGMTPREFRRKN